MRMSWVWFFIAFAGCSSTPPSVTADALAAAGARCRMMALEAIERAEPTCQAIKSELAALAVYEPSCAAVAADLPEQILCD